VKKKTFVYKDEVLKLLAKNIKMLRDQKAISQEKAAEICDLHRNTIGRLERCEIDISMTQLARLAKGFRVNVTDLLEDHTSRKKDWGA
jgi:XRE family transcriptional regulator, regulator of sulfur utilization